MAALRVGLTALPELGRPRLGRQAGRAILSACLLATFGLLPLGETLHVVFADHAHRYCAEHDRIEDVPAASPGRQADSEPAASPRLRPAEANAHTACAVLSGHLSRRLLLVSAQSTGSHPAPAAAEVQPATPLPRASSGLILLAPKNSPPRLSI